MEYVVAMKKHCLSYPSILKLLHVMQALVHFCELDLGTEELFFLHLGATEA